MIKERILKYLDFKGLSKYSFYKKTTISNGALDKKGTIGADKCELINYEYPDINLEWLITGKGEMLKSEEKIKKSTNLIPLYEDVTSIGGRNYVSEMNGISKSTEMIDAGDWFPGVTAAIRHYGDSMTEYPSGCILALRKINDRTEFSPGKNYVVETYDDRVTKRMQLSNKEGYATLYSSNTETYPDGRLRYEPYPVKLNNITGLFLVLGRIVKEHSSGPVFTQ